MPAPHNRKDGVVTRWNTSLTPAALETLLAAVHERRPEIDDAAPILIGEGISTLAYGLSSPDGEWVLRVSRRYPAPWTWRGGRGNEVELLAELRRHGVPVPDGSTVIEEVSGLPTAILERRVIGTPLTPELVHADSRLTTRTFCHRDFRIEHLIVGPDGQLVGLLDFGEVGVDDPAVDLAFLHGELGAEFVADVCTAMKTADAGLSTAARVFHSLWPLLELAPGGESWGDPATARGRLEALL